MILTMPRLLRVAGEPAPKQIATIHEGLAPAVFGLLAAYLGMPQQSLALSLGINPRTLRNRSAQGRLNREESEKSLRVARVLGRAQKVLGSPEEAKRWISSPIESLGDRKPIDLLETDIGTQEVLNVLNAIEWGVYL